MRRRQAEERGRAGEQQAEDWLVEQGWSILDRRRKTKAGEIDLIARRPGLIAFIEVKWRARVQDLGLAIDERRLSRVAAAVAAIGHEYATCGEDMRIDVILLAPGCTPDHITNAWQP
ncbi:YraN family protein [Croceibacterium sp. TMG7-5b_MA50]|uniref:YraN family protein n=1 Tax=Croceibacterium sp. TMG7-5b_MA50 TaxID=3121290 RepID=UPI0032213BAF